MENETVKKELEKKNKNKNQNNEKKSYNDDGFKKYQTKYTILLIILFFIVFILMYMLNGHAMAASIFIDGVEKDEIQTVNINNRILAPLKAFLTEFGIWPDWDATTKTITVRTSELEIIMQKDNNVATVNGERVILDSPATIIDGYTYVPVRFLGETLGMKVEWKKVAGYYGVYFKSPGYFEPGEGLTEEEKQVRELYARLEELGQQGIYLTIKDGDYYFIDVTGQKVQTQEYDEIIAKLKKLKNVT